MSCNYCANRIGADCKEQRCTYACYDVTNLSAQLAIVIADRNKLRTAAVEALEALLGARSADEREVIIEQLSDAIAASRTTIVGCDLEDK